MSPLGNKKISKDNRSTLPKDAISEVGREILQREHAFHFIQASTVLALHEDAESYLIRLMEDMNLYGIHAK